MSSLDRLLGSNPRHSEAEVVGWAKRLRHFCFMGEVSSGPMDLYEELRVRLDFEGREDLIHLLQELALLKYGVGAPPNPHLACGEQRVTDHPDLIQPKHCRIAGAACFAWVESRFVDVTCATDYHVGEANVENAVRIEAYLDAHGLQSRVNRAIAKLGNCVSAENFPERFK